MTLGLELDDMGSVEKKQNVSELRWLRECGKTPPAVCPCCVLALVMPPVAR